MRQNKLGKITASVTLEINQLDRLNESAHDSRVSRSTIVRNASGSADAARSNLAA